MWPVSEGTALERSWLPVLPLRATGITRPCPVTWNTWNMFLNNYTEDGPMTPPTLWSTFTGLGLELGQSYRMEEEISLHPFPSKVNKLCFQNE